MSFLFRVLYAAHANGTHHKLALRALELLRAADAEEWRRLFLSRAKLLLEGSKEPDKSFKDFSNHVLHPGLGPDDADWGGAPGAAENWYARLVEKLERRAWDDAVHAAGVLSHYVSDPLMPLHTGSSDEETQMHRGAEWSVSRDFEALWEAAEPISPELQSGDHWLDALIRDGARGAFGQYGPLIASYDLARGARLPEEGYDAAGREIISRQLGRAAAAISAVIDRAISEAGVAPPAVNLTTRAVIATLGVPAAWVAKKLTDSADRAAVRRIYAEIATTGRLERNVPAECRVVRQRLDRAREMGELGLASAGPRRRRRESLRWASAVVDAPSIGPKTAARLERLGVKTVGDLLVADPKSVADGLNDSRIKAPAVAAWRDQAGLLVKMPRLRRSEAVLLVAAGYRDVEAVAKADAVRMRDRLLSAAKKPEMQRALRSAIAPDLDAVRKTVAAARQVIGA